MKPSYANADMAPLKQESMLNYFAHMERVSSVLQNYAQHYLDDEIWTADIVSSYISRLTETLVLLKLRYGVNAVETLDIDMKLSGMPHRFHIDRLTREINNYKSVQIDESVIHALKQQLVEIIFTQQFCSKTMLENIAVQLYRQKLGALTMQPLTAFNGCYFSDVSGEKNSLYKCHWSCYDASENLVHIYVMLFEYDLEQPLQNSSDLVALLEKNCSNQMHLLPVARGIDRDLYHVHPKYVGRKIIGPISSRRFSVEDRVLTNLIRQHGQEDDFCIEIFTEHLYSSGEMPNVGVDEQFDDNQVIQIFYINRSDAAAADRGVSRVDRDLLMPHALAQVTGVKMNAGIQKNNQLITF